MANEVKKIYLPEGRVINESLFEMSTFVNEQGQEGKPQYTVELAFDPDQVEGEKTVEDDLIDAAVAKWGAGAEKDYLDSKIYSPLLNGDKLKARREAKGKVGDAYGGKTVVRPNTIFNFRGDKGPGGIWVVDTDNKQITGADRQAIYPGMYGVAVVTIGVYSDGHGDPALKFYLSGFQKTREGDRLVTSDNTNLFSNQGGGSAPQQEGGRRARRA